VVATALKSEYSEDQDFKTFVTLLGEGANGLRQTVLAFLTPPKLRTKGRFQSIGRLAKWAKKVPAIRNKRGQARKGSTLDKLRQSFPKGSRII
jgi:hypothetical protein